MKQYPKVFDLSAEAMKMTEAMNKMAVGKENIVWRVKDIPLTSKTHYQCYRWYHQLSSYCIAVYYRNYGPEMNDERTEMGMHSASICKERS